MVMKERATPKDAFILNRGEYDQPTEKVGRALPAVLPPLPEGEPVNRLGLARWLVSGEHPLTARVWVNPDLGTLVRIRDREDFGEFRFAGGVAHASRTARLVGGGVRQADRFAHVAWRCPSLGT